MIFRTFITAFLISGLAAPTLAEVRPRLRPALSGAEPLTQAAFVIMQGKSLRPQKRPADLAPTPVQEKKPIEMRRDPGLNRWVQGFRGRALAQGISPRVFDQAFRNVAYVPDVIRLDRNQAEFTKSIWDYLDRAVSDSRVSNGKKALRQHGRTLAAIERAYGVEKEVVAAVWGMESNYGNNRGDMPLISSLATLSYDGRRGRFFEKQLIAALKIIQSGDVRPENMTGSWAGAMGHTQFIPTSYLAFAVDFTGDGKRDIWSDNPADALASTAAYLKRSGWKKGQPWGVEVKLPRNFNYDLVSRKIKKMPSDWARLGVTDMRGRAVPDYGSAALLLPAGAQGAAFLVFRNFRAIERYNAADAYVIGVGHLSDRLRGKPAIQHPWPRGDRALKFAERKELQRRLTARGFNTQGVDGKIGPRSVAAIRAFQRSVGMAPDGYASLSVLKKLR